MSQIHLNLEGKINMINSDSAALRPERSCDQAVKIPPINLYGQMALTGDRPDRDSIRRRSSDRCGNL